MFVKFTNAKLGEAERKDFINAVDPKLLDYTIENVTEVGIPTTLNYEVTNTSRVYDAEVSITCNIVDGDNNPITSEYISMDYVPNSMIVRAGKTESGSITTTLIKSSTTAQSINVRCELNASATERTSLGEEYIPTVSFPEGYTLIDTNKNGVADEEEIAIGSEHFYVINNDATKIEALAKYNLYVGNEVDGNSWEVTPLANPTGMQDSRAKGWLDGAEKFIGTTAYSSTSQNYEGSIVKGYVDEYITKLNKSNVTGRLMTIEDLIGLGCDSNEETCERAPEWVYNTSYWTQIAYTNVSTGVWYVDSNCFFYYNNFNHSRSFGVRPVITISLS